MSGQATAVGPSPADQLMHGLMDDFGRQIGSAMGWPPMAGRAAAALMLSDAPLSMSELQEILGASKGAVSEMTRLLVLNGTVRRFKRPGTRYFVFEWRPDAWLGCLQHQLDGTTQLLDMARSAEVSVAGMPAQQRRRVADMREYYEFMTASLRNLLDAYASGPGVGATS